MNINIIRYDVLIRRAEDRNWGKRAQAAFRQSPRAGGPFYPEQAVDISRHSARVTGSESLKRTIYAEYQVCRTAHAEQRAQTNPETIQSFRVIALLHKNGITEITEQSHQMDHSAMQPDQ